MQHKGDGELMLNYSILRDIQKKETDSAATVRLEPSFYSDASLFIAEKKNEAKESGSILAIKEYENLRRIIAAIQTRREEKIALMAVRGESEAPGLSKEEGILLRELSEHIRECRGRIADVYNSNNDAPRVRKVRILKDIEPYTGLDKAVYGPFRSGEERVLPMQEADWLLKSRLAELL